MDRFKQLACTEALNKMFRGTTFYVSDVSNIAEAMGIKHRCGGPDWAALQSLHCMKWAEMSSELRMLVKEKVFEILSFDEFAEQWTPSIGPAPKERDVTPGSWRELLGLPRR